MKKKRAPVQKKIDVSSLYTDKQNSTDKKLRSLNQNLQKLSRNNWIPKMKTIASGKHNVQTKLLSPSEVFSHKRISMEPNYNKIPNYANKRTGSRNKFL